MGWGMGMKVGSILIQTTTEAIQLSEQFFFLRVCVKKQYTSLIRKFLGPLLSDTRLANTSKGRHNASHRQKALESAGHASRAPVT